ncbi:hypothetical protein GMC98_03130 [Ruminococcus bromii]|nr:hypothetical protein [Ruminococcus bromii]MTQ93778.1 hypothetical protein [Ruminococcus bromii]MTR78133.1 hypothetical protein [Ruminococcus bromii]MTR87938.1 hypothetical protein [Ruminococcus bromii]
MNDKFINLIVNLHDGDSAGAADGGDGNDENGVATSTDNNISRETRERAERIGIGDDLIDDYNKAFGSGNQNQNNNAEGENNSTDTDGEENSEEEFEKLIKGKFKNVYQNRVQSLVKDRLSTKDKQISDMQKKENTGNQIFALIANKYNVQPDDLDGLLKAVSEDKDLFAEKALAAGMTTEEARNNFFTQQKTNAQEEELETLRREKAARELDTHLRSIAAETMKEFPNFNLEEEFQNPSFRTALDFIAQQKNEQNEKTGRNDEIYDLTTAYKMAHFDSLQKDLVKRSSSAAISAAAQSIQSGARRPTENAVKKSGITTQRKSVEDMSDAEFEAFYQKVRRGEAHL